jgi:transcriptional regulator with XRE-family HTH domain
MRAFGDGLITGGDLGRAIRRLRRERGLTIESLAFTSDIHPPYLSGIERGVRNPTWRVVCDLARALEAPVSALARDAEVEALLAERLREACAELAADPRDSRVSGPPCQPPSTSPQHLEIAGVCADG